MNATYEKSPLWRIARFGPEYHPTLITVHQSASVAGDMHRCMIDIDSINCLSAEDFYDVIAYMGKAQRRANLWNLDAGKSAKDVLK